MMRGHSVSLAALVAVCSFGGGASCSGEGFPERRVERRLTVELVPPSNPGTRDEPLPLAVDAPTTFRVVVRALRPDGALDTRFTGYVRVSSKPGAIAPLTSADTEGRNVLLTEGVSPEIDVQVTNAYGTSFVVADDLGYIPVDPLRDPPPACSNGIDDDGDGKIDFPADEGCAFANDDAEQGSSYAQGVSAPIFFSLPRIADLRGLTCPPLEGCSSSGATPYPKEQVSIEAGYKDGQVLRGTGDDVAKVMVTRLSANGFYVFDRTDRRWGLGTDPVGGFNGLFVFNFNTPPRMRVCDRIKTLSGTASEFFGFTQLSYPTWTLEEWDPRRRTCDVPEPEVLSPAEINDKPNLLRLSGGLVRVETTPDRSLVVRITPNFGPGKVQQVAGGAFVPGPDASDCDLNSDGRIDFSPGSPEGLCSQACTADPECTEYSNYKARGDFRLTVSDSGNQRAAIQADASASAGFDALDNKGAEIRAFTGILSFFSGGSQYTIEARCKDDIISDPRGVPFGADNRTDLAEPPPPLACVSPRTDLELNPQ